jgi:hypothetical protein
MKLNRECDDHFLLRGTSRYARLIRSAAVALAGLLTFHSARCAPVRLSAERSSAGLEFSWPATLQNEDGSLTWPYFELQRTLDFQRWEPVGERQRAATGTAPSSLKATVTLNQARGFYRLLSVEADNLGKLGVGGAEVFGYGEAFNSELERIGQISPDQFSTMFANPAEYLPAVSWDVTTAEFWDRFNANIDEVNRDKEWGDPGFRTYDFRLDGREFPMFKTNGFVVSERLGGGSFAEVFYNLFHNDMPVFISTDALLQAWHRTYDAMLEEVEETYLFNSVQLMLDGMASQVTATSAAAGNGVLKESILDADYFLAVARSLLAGTNNPPVPTLLGQDARVAESLADIKVEKLQLVQDFMGFCREVDFSQFKIRGHYTHSERLGRYFQCVMWLGRIDIPVAGGPFDRGCQERFASTRELGSAIVLWHLLNTSGKFDTWSDMERIIQTFVGATDSMTFGQLGGLLAGAGIRTLNDIPDLAALERLQAEMVRGELGVQNIRSDWFDQPLGGPARYSLPRTFTVFGQKFVPDSWAFSQSVFSSILWTENGVTNKVPRRVPGALDVAFSILGNSQVVPDLVAQMKGTFMDADRPHAMRFRDGFNYQHNLAASRAVTDSLAASAWDSNIYMNWLACLRDLSAPTSDLKYPEAMRTLAWSKKTLNTQLASWTQLRHDTILYAKQSYTAPGACVYPTGYVEPRVEFWSRLRKMASRAAEQVATLKYEGNYTLPSPEFDPETGEPITNVVSLASIQARQVSHLASFATTVERLEGLVKKELANECFTMEDEHFIDALMEGSGRSGGASGGYWEYRGWYPQLFYRTIYWSEVLFHLNFGAGAFVPLVADVHTDLPCLDCNGDPGSVLHQAVGRANLLMIAVDNGADRFICAGPVLSHYEFEVTGAPRRISDEEWRGILLGDGYGPDDVLKSRFEGLAPPVWTRSYLAPLTE